MAEKYSIESYERPSVAADAVVFGIDTEKSSSKNRLDKKKLKILLIKRGEDPFEGMYALPGGFLRKGETIEETALRELKEEAGVIYPKILLSGVYSKSDRDPRGWIISNAFLALTKTVELVTDAHSDAVEAQWFDFFYSENGGDAIITLSDDKMREISLKFQAGISCGGGIAFDHAQIIYDAYKRLRSEVVEHGMIFDLLPEKFTISDLRQPFETIAGVSTSYQNFRKKIMDQIEEVDEFETGASHRPSRLYRKRGNDHDENFSGN